MVWVAQTKQKARGEARKGEVRWMLALDLPVKLVGGAGVSIGVDVEVKLVVLCTFESEKQEERRSDTRRRRDDGRREDGLTASASYQVPAFSI